MCIKLTLLMDLRKLMNEEKLGEAREAVFKAFVDMGERIGTVAYRKPELGLCTIIYRNSIIRLRIEGNGIAEVKVLQGNTNTEYTSETLEGIVYSIIDAIANALNTNQDNVLNAVDYVITPLDTVIGGLDT
jgi:hypothetical protein